VSAFNLSLIMRQLLGAGMPRELKNRAAQLVLRLFLWITSRNRLNGASETRTPALIEEYGSNRSNCPRCRFFWNSATCTTGC
jgi:hypothetical protein